MRKRQYRRRRTLEHRRLRLMLRTVRGGLGPICEPETWDRFKRLEAVLLRASAIARKVPQ